MSKDEYVTNFYNSQNDNAWVLLDEKERQVNTWNSKLDNLGQKIHLEVNGEKPSRDIAMVKFRNRIKRENNERQDNGTTLSSASNDTGKDYVSLN